MNVSIPTALPGGGNLPPAGSMGAGTGAVSTPPPAPIVSAAQQAAATPPPQLSSEQVKQAMEKLKVAVAPMAQNLQFSMDQGSGQTVITVVDTNTKEIIRQIPSEEMLQRSRTLDKLQGLLLNHKA